MSRVPVVKWRQQRVANRYERETWFARYRGWTLYAGRIDESAWRVSLHRFIGGGADMPSCAVCYPTLEGAQNAAEFYAENNRWPHAKVPA